MLPLADFFVGIFFAGHEETNNLQTLTQRLLLGTAAAGSGWLGGMVFLRVVHPWAYDTEFRWWALTSGAYAVLPMVVIATWIARSHSGSTWSAVAGGMLRFALSATILPLCLAPFTNGFSIVLLVTGHAFVIAAVAAMVYLLKVTSEPHS